MLVNAVPERLRTASATQRRRPSLLEFGSTFALPRIYASFLVAAPSLANLFRPLERRGWLLGIQALALPVLEVVHGSAVRYVAATSLLIAMAIAPWVEIVFLLQLVRWRTLFTRSFFIRSVLAIASGFAIFEFMGVATSWFDRHGFILLVLAVSGGAVFVLFVLFLLIKLIQALLLMHRDRAHLRQATISTALTRVSIATDFYRFQTGWGRVRYVRWLRDAQVKPLGSWPEIRPNIGSEEASTMLAQLDERWLGIEG